MRWLPPSIRRCSPKSVPKMGLFWILDEAGYAWHNGGTAGSSCFFAVDWERQRAVVVIANGSLNDATDALGMALIAHESGPLEPMPTHDLEPAPQLLYSAPQAGLRGRPSAALTTESSPDATLHQLGRKRHFESTEGVTVRGFDPSQWAGRCRLALGLVKLDLVADGAELFLEVQGVRLGVRPDGEDGLFVPDAGLGFVREGDRLFLTQEDARARCGRWKAPIASASGTGR